MKTIKILSVVLVLCLIFGGTLMAQTAQEKAKIQEQKKAQEQEQQAQKTQERTKEAEKTRQRQEQREQARIDRRHRNHHANSPNAPVAPAIEIGSVNRIRGSDPPGLDRFGLLGSAARNLSQSQLALWP